MLLTPRRRTPLPVTLTCAVGLCWTLALYAQTPDAPKDTRASATAAQEAGQGRTPAANADAVWKRLQAAEYRSAWAVFPGTRPYTKGRDPHGALLTTYVNDIALKGIKSNAATMPVGSMLVKENYGPDKTLAAVTLMYKAPAYDPANGDWFWMKRLADGTVEASGKVAGCQDCHRKGHDFIRTSLPQ